MGDALRHSFQNVSAVFAPSCISHAILTKKDWQTVKIDDISAAEALHCWEQKINKRRIRKLKQIKNVSKRLTRRKKKQAENCESDNVQKINSSGSNRNTIIRTRKKKNKKDKNHKRHKDTENTPLIQNGTELTTLNKIKPTVEVPSKSNHNTAKRLNKRVCAQKRLERCSWPQCNHSCPKLHNPITGEEMDFIELLKSFGLEMESVAHALGIDMQTLNNMDQAELLNLLTQQSSNINNNNN